MDHSSRTVGFIVNGQAVNAYIVSPNVLLQVIDMDFIGMLYFNQPVLKVRVRLLKFASS